MKLGKTGEGRKEGADGRRLEKRTGSVDVVLCPLLRPRTGECRRPRIRRSPRGQARPAPGRIFPGRRGVRPPQGGNEVRAGVFTRQARDIQADYARWKEERKADDEFLREAAEAPKKKKKRRQSSSRSKEQWRNLRDWPYEVSNKWRVRSKSRANPDDFLTPQAFKGRPYVQLRDGERRKKVQVAWLMVEAGFLRPGRAGREDE